MTDPPDFRGKVALVTGAAAGIGLATARAVPRPDRGRRHDGRVTRRVVERCPGPPGEQKAGLADTISGGKPDRLVKNPG